jgi:hypothetical protein
MRTISVERAADVLEQQQQVLDEVPGLVRRQ